MVCSPNTWYPPPFYVLFLLNAQPKCVVLDTQLCLTLCDPMDRRPPGCPAHGILQARILEWVAISFSRGIFPIQGLNPGLPHCREILYHLSHQGSPNAQPGSPSNAENEQRHMQVVIWEAILGNRNKGPGKWNKEGEKLIRQWITEFTGQLGLDFTRAFGGIYRLPERDRKKRVPVGLSITIEDFSWGYRQSYSVKRLQARKQMKVNACLRRGDVSIWWSFIGTACYSQCWSQKWG